MTTHNTFEEIAREFAHELIGDDALSFGAKQRIESLVAAHQAALDEAVQEARIEELNNVPNHTAVNLYVRDRLANLKKGK